MCPLHRRGALAVHRLPIASEALLRGHDSRDDGSEVCWPRMHRCLQLMAPVPRQGQADSRSAELHLTWGMPPGLFLLKMLSLEGEIEDDSRLGASCWIGNGCWGWMPRWIGNGCWGWMPSHVVTYQSYVIESASLKPGTNTGTNRFCLCLVLLLPQTNANACICILRL